MKPSEKQLEGLQKYLKSVLKYRESYEEIYDHILSALEDIPNGISFENAVNDTIKRDFGGHDNLYKVEESIGSGVYLNKQTEFNKHLKSLFNIKTIPWMLIAGISSYGIITLFNVSSGILKVTTVGLAFVPSVTALLWLFNLGYLGGQRGLYALDHSIANISWFPMMPVGMLMAWFPAKFSNFPDFFSPENALLPTLVIMAIIIYDVAFIKFYRAELKAVINLKE